MENSPLSTSCPTVDQRYAGVDDDPLFDLFKYGAFSDVTIKCGARVWKLHKNILSARCRFFASMFKDSYKEASSNIVVLDDDEPTSLGILLRHLYVKYDEKISEEFYDKRHANFQERGLKLSIATAITADKYSALGLVSLAVDNLNAVSSFAAREEWQARLVFTIVTPAVFGAEACTALGSLKEPVADFIVENMRRNEGVTVVSSQSLHEYEELMTLVLARLEATSQEVTLNDHDPDALHAVLRHLYVRYDNLPSEYAGLKDQASLARFSINLITTADQLGVLALVSKAQKILSDFLDISKYMSRGASQSEIDVLMETMVPAIFGGQVCAALETLKGGMSRSIATAFHYGGEFRDQINDVLCAYPELNKRILECHIPW